VKGEQGKLSCMGHWFFTYNVVLLVWLNRGSWNGRKMWHLWINQEMHAIFCLGNRAKS